MTEECIMKTKCQKTFRKRLNVAQEKAACFRHQQVSLAVLLQGDQLGKKVNVSFIKTLES